MKLQQEFVLRELAGEFYLVPTGSTVMNLNGMILMNDLGAEIWKLLPEAQSTEDIARKLFEQFDAPMEEIRSDVEEFLSRLRELKILA